MAVFLNYISLHSQELPTGAKNIDDEGHHRDGGAAPGGRSRIPGRRAAGVASSAAADKRYSSLQTQYAQALSTLKEKTSGYESLEGRLHELEREAEAAAAELRDTSAALSAEISRADGLSTDKSALEGQLADATAECSKVQAAAEAA